MNKNFLFGFLKDVRPEHLKKHSSCARNAAFVPLRNGWGSDLAKPRNCAGSAKEGNHFRVGVHLIHSLMLAIATLVVNSHSYNFFI